MLLLTKIQRYFGYAIRNNKGNPDRLVKAITDILHHMTRGPPYEGLAAILYHMTRGPP